jgi:hypothetical protein
MSQTVTATVPPSDETLNAAAQGVASQFGRDRALEILSAPDRQGNWSDAEKALGIIIGCLKPEEVPYDDTFDKTWAILNAN